MAAYETFDQLPWIGLPFEPRKVGTMMSSRGHAGFIGMEYRDHSEAWVELALPWREDLVGVEETGVLASGPIISLLDNACSMAVWIRRGEFRPQVTLDLRVDYVRAAAPGRTVVARCECYQVKRSVAFVRGLAYDGELDDPVAHAAGTFMLMDGAG